MINRDIRALPLSLLAVTHVIRHFWSLHQFFSLAPHMSDFEHLHIFHSFIPLYYSKKKGERTGWQRWHNSHIITVCRMVGRQDKSLLTFLNTFRQSINVVKQSLEISASLGRQPATSMASLGTPDILQFQILGSVGSKPPLPGGDTDC